MQRLRNTIYHLVSLLTRFAGSQIQPKTLLLIKTDEIGDYILWRNVLPCIRTATAFRDYKITLVGNQAWKELALTFDRAYVDDFIWLDKKQFKSNMGYRYSFLKSVRKKGFEKLVNCIFSRSPRVDDAIVFVCDRSYKIGMARNEHNVAPFEKGYDNGLYDMIHSLPMTGLFEFTRNCQFTSLFLNQPCEPLFGLDVSALPVPGDLPENYAVIFPGSGRADRKWHSRNFADAARFLHIEKGFSIIFAGGAGDKPAVKEVANRLDFPTLNLAGETTLVDFAVILANAKLLVSIDTGAVHLAAATGCKVYGIFNGDQFGRFAPYPPDILKEPFIVIYPDEIEKDGGAVISEKYQYFSGLKHNAVGSGKLIRQLSNE